MTHYLKVLYFIFMLSMILLGACTNLSERGVTGAGDSMFTDADLLDRTFVIEDVSGHGIIDSSHITLMFGSDGQVNGKAGCNAFFGGYQRVNAELEFGPLATTRKLCAPALMHQEQAVLAVLADVTHIERDKQGALIVSTADGRSLRGFESTQAIQTYQCDDGTIVKVSYPTQETATLFYQNQTIDMIIAPSASGARYISSDWQWWSKGSQATLAPLIVNETIASEIGITCRK